MVTHNNLTFSTISDSPSICFFSPFCCIYFSGCSFIRYFSQLFNCPTHNLYPDPYDVSSDPLSSWISYAGNGGVQLVSVGVIVAPAWSIVYCCMIWHQFCIWAYKRSEKLLHFTPINKSSREHRELWRSTNRWWGVKWYKKQDGHHLENASPCTS